MIGWAIFNHVFKGASQLQVNDHTTTQRKKMSQNNEDAENQSAANDHHTSQAFLELNHNGRQQEIQSHSLPCQHAMYARMQTCHHHLEHSNEDRGGKVNGGPTPNFGTTSLYHWVYWDDPWLEHAKVKPTCKFLLQKKGPEFVHLILSLYPNISHSQRIYALTPTIT